MEIRQFFRLSDNTIDQKGVSAHNRSENLIIMGAIALEFAQALTDNIRQWDRCGHIYNYRHGE